MTITHHYEHLVATCAVHGVTYGDFLLGTIMRLSFIPENIFNFAPILLNYDKWRYLIESLMRIRQIKQYSIVTHSYMKRELIYIDHLYTVLPSFPQKTFSKRHAYLNQGSHDGEIE